jgi:hypothetical protein
MDQVQDTPAQATVRQDEDMWILRVESNGKVQEYRCGSEVQARALAILLLPTGDDRAEDPTPTLS